MASIELDLKCPFERVASAAIHGSKCKSFIEHTRYDTMMKKIRAKIMPLYLLINEMLIKLFQSVTISSDGSFGQVSGLAVLKEEKLNGVFPCDGNVGANLILNFAYPPYELCE